MAAALESRMLSTYTSTCARRGCTLSKSFAATSLGRDLFVACWIGGGGGDAHVEAQCISVSARGSSGVTTSPITSYSCTSGTSICGVEASSDFQITRSRRRGAPSSSRHLWRQLVAPLQNGDGRHPSSPWHTDVLCRKVQGSSPLPGQCSFFPNLWRRRCRPRSAPGSRSASGVTCRFFRCRQGGEEEGERGARQGLRALPQSYIPVLTRGEDGELHLEPRKEKSSNDEREGRASIGASRGRTKGPKSSPMVSAGVMDGPGRGSYGRGKRGIEGSPAHFSNQSSGMTKQSNRPRPNPPRNVGQKADTDAGTESGGGKDTKWKKGIRVPQRIPSQSNDVAIQSNRSSQLSSRSPKVIRSAHETSISQELQTTMKPYPIQKTTRDDKPTRLSKVLAAAGVASRRSCEELIFAGKVKVNGELITVPQTQVDPKKDSIYVNGSQLPKRKAPKLYFLLNKPKGYICSNAEDGKRLVVDLFDDFTKDWKIQNPNIPKPRLFTVGRLDVATTGLLLVTNDGDFVQKVAHPSSGITKEYIVSLDEKPTRRQMLQIQEGTEVQGVHVRPLLVETVTDDSGSSKHRLRIEVGEGRTREVRELLSAAGLEVKALKRVRIGNLRLPRKLMSGKYQQLEPKELSGLLSLVSSSTKAI